MGSKKKNKTSAGDSAGAGEDAKGKEVISDPRFSKVHSDPRFQKFSKRKTKIAIDDRFSSLFTDNRFAGSSAPVDKRGKPRKHSENALRRYYRELEDGDEEENEHKKKQIEKEEEEGNEGTGAESPDSESSESETESESDSESESDGDLESDASTSTTDSDDEADDAVISGDDDASVEVENVPVIERETHRLAVVNMDWSQVKATDLFVMLSSFLPKGGQIKTVTVYPSEFGLQRMQEEAVRGPAALFDDEEKKDGDDEDEDEEEEIDTEKLREYEKSRLRYYYAVVECDSVATADYLYKACDGVEFERSSNVLDLRFIPDSMEFKHPPRDVATEAPTDYDGLDFHTRALQHSNVVLSWDDDEPHRKKTLRRKFNEKQLAELELKEFLASDESESENGDEDEGDNEDISGKKEKKLEMYRALVQSGDGSEEENDDGQEMEVTFNTGLEDLSTKILEKNYKGSETVWEAYLRKRKEKKKARKSRSKNSSDDESDESDDERPEQPDDFFEEDPSVGKTKKSGNARKSREEKGSVEDKAAEASRAELELLLADEKGAEKKVKGHRIKHKKGKKGEEAIDEDSIPTIDEDDPRFAALFTNPVFALDPTDPQFKRSATYLRQLAKKQNKAREKRADKGPMEQSKESSSDLVEQKEKQSSDTPRKEKNELSSIVKSLKMKSQQFSKPPGGTSKKEKMGLKGSAMKEKKHKLPSLDRPKQKKTKV